MFDSNPRTPAAQYPGVPMEAQHAPGTHGVANLREVVAGLRRRWWLMVITTTLGVAAAVFLVKRETPHYVGAALIRLVEERPAVIGSLGDPALLPSATKNSEWIQSQLLVFQSRGVAGLVVDREGTRLTSLTPEFPRGRLEDVFVGLPPDTRDSVLVTFRQSSVLAARGSTSASVGYGEVLDLGDVRFVVREKPPIAQARLLILDREAAIDAVASGFAAWSRAGTDAIEVRYTSTDRRLAVRLVNAYVHAFRDENARVAQEQTARRRAFVEEQLNLNDSTLRRAQQALIDFRSERKLYSSTERIAAEQSTLAQLDTRRQELDSDLKLFRSMLTRAEAAEGEDRHRLLDALVSAPGLGENALIGQLRGEVFANRAELARANAQYTELHPEVRRVASVLEDAQQRLMTAVQMHIATMEARVAALEDMSQRARARLEPLPAAEAQELRLVQDVETARALGEQLRAEYQRVRTTQAVEAGQVSIVNLAARATTGNRHPYVKLGVGALIGLGLGIGFALLLEALNTSIRQQNELPTLLRVPQLGVIPHVAEPRRYLPARRMKIRNNGSRNGANGGVKPPAAAKGLITTIHTQSVGSEAYRTLRTTLLFSESGKGVKTFVVTSACVGDGKTTVAANLAVSFAQQGFRVLLMDADPRRPRLHELFGESREPGLSDLLTLAPGAANAVRSTAIENLDLIPSGTTPPNPAELVGGQRMRALLGTLSEGYDVVLIDAPPVLGAADPMVLAAKADGVLFVVRAGHTGRDEARYAVEQLERVGARVIGAVLNDPDSVAVRYGRAYGYAYATDD